MRLVRLAIGLTILGVVMAVVVTLSAPEATPLGRFTPAPVAYSIHAGLGMTLNLLGLSPVAAATQWVRAASHAGTSEEVDTAGQGIATARQRSADDWRVDDVVCDAYVVGAPSVRAAIGAAGVPCSADAAVFEHAPEGAAITYASRPPVGGPHYPVPYPEYGLSDVAVAPGYWVHNLEHGALVLLYRCAVNCPEQSMALQGLYDALTGANSHSRLTRLLITPYADMDHRFAIIAWGHKFEMDKLDLEQAEAFYAAYIDRGPECRNYVCPN